MNGLGGGGGSGGHAAEPASGADGTGSAAGGAMVAGGGAFSGMCGAPKIRVNAPGSRRKGTASKRFSTALDFIGGSNKSGNPPALCRGDGETGDAAGDSFCADGLKGELKKLVNSPGVLSLSGGGALGTGGAWPVVDGATGVGAPWFAPGAANNFVNSPCGAGDAGAPPAAGDGCSGALNSFVNSPGARAGGAGGGTGYCDRGVSVWVRARWRRSTSPGGTYCCGASPEVGAGADELWSDAGAA